MLCIDINAATIISSIFKVFEGVVRYINVKVVAYVNYVLLETCNTNNEMER